MSSKANILFVDDEKRVLNSMRGLFRRDFELFLTTEGATAVKIAAENSIDVIVADQRMPGMNGTEVLGRIRQLSPRTVRILLTGYADPSAVEGSINIGEVFRFLSKPCPPQLLRETLELAIAAARTKRAASPPSGAAAPVMPAATPNNELTGRTVPESADSQAGQTPAGPPLVRARPEIALVSVAQPTQNDAAATPDNSTPVAATSHWQSVTEVVLSGDSSQEFRQQTVSPGSASTSKILSDIGVVFFTIDSDLAEAGIRAISPDRRVHLATSLTRVIEYIEQQNVGVLVTDFSKNTVVLRKIIAVLKHYVPELVTVIISGNRDTTDMIDLINFGRVFRYLLKPIEPEELRQEITAAAAHHLYLRSNPELTRRQEAVDQPDTAGGSESARLFVSRIQNLQNRRRPVGRSGKTPAIKSDA